MSLTQHISFAQLADLAENRSATDESQATRQHLAACHSCEQEWARLAGVVALMREDASVDPPRDVVFSVVNMFRAARPAQPSRARRVLAALSFDSADNAPAFGLRSGASAGARQILFSAEGYELDLRVILNGAQATLSGQVLGEDCAHAAIILENAAARVTAALNGLCEFTLPSVPPGVYTLRLQIADGEIVIPDLELKA